MNFAFSTAGKRSAQETQIPSPRVTTNLYPRYRCNGEQARQPIPVYYDPEDVATQGEWSF